MAATTEQGGISDTEHWTCVCKTEGKRVKKRRRKKKKEQKTKTKFEVSSPTGNQRKKEFATAQKAKNN